MSTVGAEKSLRCAACGGRLTLLVEIRIPGMTHERGPARTRYFRCENCAQIRVVEE